MKVLTLGSFDMLHIGHIRLIKKCMRYGTTVIGLNSDSFIERYRGRPPVMNYDEREGVIQEVFPEVGIIPNNQYDGSIKDVLDEVKPNAIIVGSDWLRKDYLKQIGMEADYLDSMAIDLIFTPYDWSMSSTEVKRRVNANSLIGNSNKKS